MGEFRVKFRTGRDPNESEARASAGDSKDRKKHRQDRAKSHARHNFHKSEALAFAGGSEHSEKSSLDPKEKSIRQSLHRNMRFVIKGVQNSTDGWQLHEMVYRAFIYMSPVVARYDSSGALRDEAGKLRTVLLQKGDKELPNMENGGQRQFRAIIDEVDRAATEYARAHSANATRHSSLESVSSKSNADLNAPREQGGDPKP